MVLTEKEKKEIKEMGGNLQRYYQGYVDKRIDEIRKSLPIARKIKKR